MKDQKQRSFLVRHAITIALLVSATAVMVCLNIDWGWSSYRYGWPYAHSIYVAHMNPKSYPVGWEYRPEFMAFDFGISLLYLFVLGCVCELVRRRRRGLLRIHLSTGIVAMGVLGILIGANTDWGMPFFDYFTNTPFGAREHNYHLGWPDSMFMSYPDHSYFRASELVFDLSINFCLLFTVIVMFEYLLRNRKLPHQTLDQPPAST